MSELAATTTTTTTTTNEPLPLSPSPSPSSLSDPRLAGFDSLGIFRDSQDRAILARIKCGSKYIYRYLPDMPELYLFMGYYHLKQAQPDSWVGDMFLDSNLNPIMFRYRSATADATAVHYQRIVSDTMMLAVIESDEDAIAKLALEDEKGMILDAVLESEAKRARRTVEDTAIINAD